jgi:hypothetical protein
VATAPPLPTVISYVPEAKPIFVPPGKEDLIPPAPPPPFAYPVPPPPPPATTR